MLIDVSWARQKPSKFRLRTHQSSPEGDKVDGIDGVDEPAHRAIPFAGGEGTHSVLSILDGAHSIGEGFLGFLTMKESNALRGVCVEFREAVMDFPWMDRKSHIKGSLRA